MLEKSLFEVNARMITAEIIASRATHKQMYTGGPSLVNTLLSDLNWGHVSYRRQCHVKLR